MGVVMLFTTIGPALGAELLLHKMRPVSPLVRQRNELRSREKKTARELNRNVTAASDAAQKARCWDDEEAHLRAAYLYAYLAEEARLQNKQQHDLQLPPDSPDTTAFNVKPNGKFPEMRQ